MNTHHWFATYWEGSARDAACLRRWSEDWDALQHELRETAADRQQRASQYLSTLRHSTQRAAPPDGRALPSTLYLPTAQHAPQHSMAAGAQIISFPGSVEPLLPGQVLALPALTACGHPGRTYVLLIEAAGQACWEVIPFSPLAYPATDDEWQLPSADDAPHESLAERGCHVLCYWQHLSLSTAVLHKAEPVAQLSAEAFAALLDLWHIYRATGALPLAGGSGATGLGLLEDDDPRSAYRGYCQSLLQPWQHLVPLPPGVHPAHRAPQLSLAVSTASPAAGAAETTLELDGHDDILHLRLLGPRLTLEFRDSAGHPTHRWDGSLLIATDGWATSFRTGTATAEVRRLRDGFMLVDASGSVIPVLT